MTIAYRVPNFDVVETFLADNEVYNGWKELIFGDNKVKSCLWQIISELEMHRENGNWPYAPKSHQILRAFALCEPENVKVIIVGTSPITGEVVANGLAFSSNTTEDELTENQAIFKVHKVLKEAGILDKQYNYNCGHEEWARNGVLLLNAALAIGLTDDSANTIQKHCRKWRPFITGLLNTWIRNTSLEQTIFVMLWGYKDRRYEESENYAKEVWNGIDNVPCNFIVREAHHPTFPGDQSINNFIQRTTCHFGEIVYFDFEYINAFTINGRCLHIVNKFLKENEVKDEWKRLIFSNNDLQVSLINIIIKLQLGDNDANNNLAPRRDQLLRALTFCDPKDVKVVIIGASSTAYRMANGLAFSADATESGLSEDNARYILKVHDALRRAGILNHHYDYYSGHEEWAEKGVLLLNAALTMELNGYKSAKILKKHCEIWRPFLVKLLKTWIEETDLQHMIFVMLWGHECKLRDFHADNYSREIWNQITDVPRNFVVRHAHHPTFPRRDNNFLEMATEHFAEIARQYYYVFETNYA